jgi:subtilisin family serine protease
LEFAIRAPDGQVYEGEQVNRNTGFGIVDAVRRLHPLNRDYNVNIEFFNVTRREPWTLILRSLSSQVGRFDIWAQTPRPGTSQGIFQSHVCEEVTIGIPSTTPKAIVVTSYVSKNAWEGKDGVSEIRTVEPGQISPFSSLGPTRDGLNKPDIAAPGQFITASFTQASEAQGKYPENRITPEGRYLTIQGASMAAPMVTGIIALMLQQNPSLTPEEIIRRFRYASREDNDTFFAWNKVWGFGKIDAERLLR